MVDNSKYSQNSCDRQLKDWQSRRTKEEPDVEGLAADIGYKTTVVLRLDTWPHWYQTSDVKILPWKSKDELSILVQRKDILMQQFISK